MAEENPDGISDILLSLQANDEDSETLLPTLTLYTGERLPSDPKPPINLHLSLGGSYSEISNATPDVHESAAVNNLASFIFADNSSMMKRSYLEQNKMAQKDQEKIILIDNVQGITGGKQKSRRNDTAPDLKWAAQSASENPALLRALQIIKSESSNQHGVTRAKADHNQGDTSAMSHAIRFGVASQPDYQYDTYDMSHAIQGVAWQPEIVFQALEHGNSMNPDDFLSISPSNCAVNVDIGLSMPSDQDPPKETSATSSMIPPASMDDVSANAEPVTPENLAFPILFPAASDKGKSVMVVDPSESARILTTPITYYGTNDDGNLIANFSTSKSGPAAFATEISSSRSTPYMPQGAIGRGNSAPPTCFSNSYPGMPMSNPVPPFMACTSSKENAISNLMHYDPYMAAAANANSHPAAFAFGSNRWANASIPMAVPISGFPSGGSNAVNIPPEPSKGHPLMKRNEYLPDSQIELIRNMPTVATDGGIPDGRRIEGFLYQYSKYEEVIIVCLCHGCFFTPREFVMHAGCSEVENPMKLITIVPDD